MGSSTAPLRGRACTALAACVLAGLLAFAGDASARGGDYAIQGGSERHQAQVRLALEASAFDWDVVPGRVTIHLVRGVRPFAMPRHIWLDPALLEAGMFSWAVVQDEYAHQVDFLVLTPFQREVLRQALGATVWCHADRPGLPHAAYGCERFTSTLVWAYWPVRQNAYRPRNARDEAAAMRPAPFRSLVGRLLAAGEGPHVEPYSR